LSLADGTEIAAASIISTLDLKRTFLSLFKWEELPSATVQRVNLFRLGAAAARLLVALDRLPEGRLTQAALRGPIFIAPDCRDLARAYGSWRAGVLPDELALTLRFVSTVDPALAPPGQATMTVTVGGVPHHFFDGTWTHARRDQLRARVLKAIDDVLPGMSTRVLALKLIAPPDIEEAIGRTDGDLDGGEIAPDQMLHLRPWSARPVAPHTPLRGFYLAGPSTTSGALALCASGAAAAEAVIAETKRGWLR
jgi:phytoene dehydrogenase-like protein